jgi:potassium efflux system protein
MLFFPRMIGILLLAMAFATALPAFSPPVAAQQNGDSQPGPAASTPVAAAPTISADVIRSRLQAIEANDQLDPTVKDRVIAVYRQILTNLDANKAYQESIQLWSTRRAEVPEQLDELNRQLETWTSEFPLPDASELTQVQLDRRVNELQLELTAAQSKLNQLKAEPKRREDLRLEIPQRVATLVDTTAQLDRRKASDQARTDVATEIRDAEQLALSVQLDNVALETQQFRDELAYYDAADEVLTKQIELAEKSVERLTRELATWRSQAERLRQESAAKDIAEKATEVSDVPVELQPLAQFNLQLAETLQQTVHKIAAATEQQAAVDRQIDKWDEQLTRVRSLIAAQSGVTESVGNLLREQREELPDLRELRKQSQTIRESLYDIRSDEFTTDEMLEDFADFEARVERERRDLEQHNPSDRVQQLEPRVRSLLDARQRTLEDLRRNYRLYLNHLVMLNIQQDSLIRLVDEYTQYINERVLWIRSIPPVELADVRAIPQGLRWLNSADSWRELMGAVSHHVRRTASYHILIALLLIICFAYRSYGIQQIQKLGEQAAAKGCRNFRVTAQAFFWTLAVSAAGPALLSWVGWTLSDVVKEHGTEFAGPFAAATMQAALAYWPFSFWRTAVRRNGLAESHFQWSTAVRTLTRRHLRWFVPTVVVLTASYHLFSDAQNPVWERSIARFSLATLSICTTVFLWFMFSPKKGVPREYLAKYQFGWFDRLRFIWFGLILSIPATLAVQVLLGYQYTVERLAEYLFWSVIFVSTIYLLHAIASRWILINRRRLAIAQAKERLLTGGPPPTERDPGELQGGITENSQLDLTEVNAQTQRLLKSFTIAATGVGLFLIWIEVLPALARMNDVRLWRYAEATPAAVEVVAADGNKANSNGSNESTSSSSNGQSASRPGASVTDTDTDTSSVGWVTLGALLGSLVILTLSLVAVRNIPGLLEIVVLQHLPLDASIRFAITTITRYALILTGLVWAFTNIGFGWSKIQWLAAGVSVGLGFGLQEIFANFVAGIILLFERPLRVGDVVTVGGVTGTVVQIRTRATTIRDWDRKELIVPNKEFITGQLLNWTLSDEMSRIVMTIGVAYGSDIRRARDVIMNCTLTHPSVLKEPGPSVTFDLFGESALNLTLRCFVLKLADRMPVTHELHELIYSELTAAGFAIPFPQRDVHLHLDSNGKGLIGRTVARKSLTDTG